MLLCELDGRVGCELAGELDGRVLGCWWMLFCGLGAGGMQFGVLVDAVLFFELAGC